MTKLFKYHAITEGEGVHQKLTFTHMREGVSGYGLNLLTQYLKGPATVLLCCTTTGCTNTQPESQRSSLFDYRETPGTKYQRDSKGVKGT